MKKNCLLCYFTFSLNLFFLSSCGQYSVIKATHSKTPTAPSTNITVNSNTCNMPSISQEFKNKYYSDPIANSLFKAYEYEAANAKNSKSPFGDKFIEIEPTDLYSELFYCYGTHAPYGTDSGTGIDDITRKTLLTNKNYSKSKKNQYDDNINPEKNIRELNGFFYKGSTIEPSKLFNQCGLSSSLFYFDSNDSKINFQDIVESKSNFYKFRIDDHLNNGKNSIYTSLTRSVHVAKKFAVKPGYYGARKEGYVYVFYTKNGIDIGKNKKSKSNYKREQEVAELGFIPTQNLVAYRKIEEINKSISDFSGKIYIRNDFQRLEPEAYNTIVKNLSTLSRVTEEYKKDSINWEKNIRKIHTEIMIKKDENGVYGSDKIIEKAEKDEGLNAPEDQDY